MIAAGSSKRRSKEENEWIQFMSLKLETGSQISGKLKKKLLSKSSEQKNLREKKIE